MILNNYPRPVPLYYDHSINSYYLLFTSSIFQTNSNYYLFPSSSIFTHLPLPYHQSPIHNP